VATLAELEEATAFERFALVTGAPVSRPQYGWVDLREHGSVGNVIGSINSSEESLDRLRLQLRPLMFGAAWKILDLVIEYALPPPSGNYWSIREKVARATSQTSLTPWPPFSASDPEWDAALRMYAETEELRHGLVHRDIQRDSQTKALTVIGQRSPNVGSTFTMTDAEQLAFCRAAQLLIDGVLAGQVAPRDRDELAFQLAQVHQYSGVAPNPTPQLRWVCEMHIDLWEAGGGWVELDVAALDAATHHQRESYRAFDLVAYPPDAPGGAPLVGKLEGARLDRPVMRFRMDAPPTWLSDTRQRQTLTGKVQPRTVPPPPDTAAEAQARPDRKGNRGLIAGLREKLRHITARCRKP